MKSQIQKIKTYINFAFKSREIKLGVDDIITSRGAKLILVSKGLAESSYKKMEAFAKRNNVSLFLLELEDFVELLQSENIKAIAIFSGGLADAIKKNLTNF